MKIRFFLENCKDSLKTNLVRDTPDNYQKIQYHFRDKDFGQKNKKFFLDNIVPDNTRIYESTGNPTGCKLLLYVIYRANMRMGGAYDINYIISYLDAGSDVSVVIFRYQINDAEFDCKELKDLNVDVFEFDIDTNKENLVTNFISKSQKTNNNIIKLKSKILSLSTPTPNETRKTWILISLLGLSVGSGIFLYIYTPKDKRKNLTDQPGRIMAVTIFAPMLIYKSWKYRDIEVGMFGSILWLWDMYWLIKRKPQKNHIITSNGVISKYDFPID